MGGVPSSIRNTFTSPSIADKQLDRRMRHAIAKEMTNHAILFTNRKRIYHAMDINDCPERNDKDMPAYDIYMEMLEYWVETQPVTTTVNDFCLILEKEGFVLAAGTKS